MLKNDLSDLFAEEEQELFTSNGKVLFFDLHNLAYRCVFSCIHFNPEDNDKFYLWRHMMVNSMFNSILKFNPDKVILAVDKKGSWRYDIFDGYKASRKGFRDKAVVDFEKFHVVYENFIQAFKKTFKNIYTMQIDNCEADDIIAVLCKEVFINQEEIIIISSDKDMNQLLVNKNIKQFDAVNNKFMECINPKLDLDVKIITGDKSDSIPSIKFRVGPKTALKILDEGLDDYLNEEGNEEIKDNWERNKRLIDFNYIPKYIRDRIIDNYNNYDRGIVNGDDLVNFFIKNGLSKLMDSWAGYESVMDSLS